MKTGPPAQASVKDDGPGIRESHRPLALGDQRSPLLRRRPHRRRGYILFELVLALGIFAIAVLGLAKTLNQALETANLLKRDQIIRIGMRNFLEEIRRKPLTEMSLSTIDTTYGVTYTSTTEPVSLRTTRGDTLTDIYNLTIKATSSFNNVPQEDTLSVYVYKPAQQQR